MNTRIGGKIISVGLMAGAIMVAGFSGCVTAGKKADQSATNAPVLRVGVTPNMPPLVYKQGSDVIGLEADLARALGAELGRPVRFVELKWAGQISALLENKTDIIMSGMSVTKTRAMRIAFTDSYLEVGQLALVRRSDLDRFFSRGSVMLTTGIVGVEKGTLGDLFVQQEFPHAKRVAYASPRKAVKALIKERIDLFVHDAPVVWWQAAACESEGVAAVNIPLTTEYLAWGMRVEDAALLKAVNDVLARWKLDEKLQGIVRRWIPYARTL